MISCEIEKSFILSLQNHIFSQLVVKCGHLFVLELPSNDSCITHKGKVVEDNNILNLVSCKVKINKILTYSI